ncbi:MAG: GT4 family glycosyltransferase PelF [Planctomycetota bacterium]|jgi:glycosyltransferase involved in cell wall biosynthesis
MRADVCLVLEGTYPFVSGGVSSWVHHLTSHLSHLTFTVLHISPKRGYYTKGPVYQMPGNVVGLKEVYLHDYVISAQGRPADLRAKVEFFRALVRDMVEGKSGSFAAFLAALQEEGNEGFSAFDLLQTPESWEVLVDNYRQEASNESFLNFFWTWRYAYLPLFNLLSTKIPRARVYHTISTGYAGLLAAGAKTKHRRPMLLTEHGIYTKERRIEINRSDWIQDWDSGELVAERKAPYFRRYWIRQFQMMSRITYEYADEIFTLYTGNTREQMKDGADPRKIRVIPNGIDLDRFGEAAAAFDARPQNDRFTVCFVGRICPIKDIMTFISAMRLVANEVPDVRVRMLGPMDEDPEYAEMCQRHARQLGLENNLAFEGKVNVLEEFPKVDVMVLTSISEAQPLVILEAGAVGIPTVATDVGSCSELLCGVTPEDRAIGVGGIITPMASPGETARAILQLYRSPGLRRRMRDSMRERVRTFYDQRDMVAAYEEIYQRHRQGVTELPEAAVVQEVETATHEEPL